jgi:eukaryotic-like serine/threonine-protein kinase
MNDARPSTIGRYHIQQLIGEGAMGSVYRALDPVLNRIVAVKVMADAVARDGELRDRFLREAQTAGSLQHPNIVTVFDFGEVQGHLYIAMEFVEGTDLDRLLTREEQLPLARKLEIMIDVLTGLSYAHRHGVVHRDVKPANIRVVSEGRAKLMDFGVAHLESARMTATGAIMGTPNYMAPEQVSGARLGPAADIFSAGAVLYELLTTKMPFSGDTLHNVLYRIMNEQPPALAIVAPELPSELDIILQKALAKDPEERYRHATDMANDLTRVVAKVTGRTNAETLSLSASLRGGSAFAQDASAARDAVVARSSRGRTRDRMILGGFGVAAAVAIVATVMVLNRNRDEPVNQAAGVSAIDSGRSTAALPDSLPLPSTPAAPPARPAVSDTPAPRSEPPPNAEREAAIVRAIRASVVRSRARAAEAGATPALLAAGDALLRTADRLTNQKQHAEAVASLNAASAAWADAEREARTTANAPVSRAVDTTTPPPPVVQRVEPVTSAPIIPKAPEPKLSQPAEIDATKTRADIAALVTAYARAIESRDLALVRAAYPAITGEQQRRFQQFFESVRTLRVTLSAERVEPGDATATATIAGAYEYTGRDGARARQPVTFQATFRREDAGWRIVSVR